MSNPRYKVLSDKAIGSSSNPDNNKMYNEESHLIPNGTSKLTTNKTDHRNLNPHNQTNGVDDSQHKRSTLSSSSPSTPSPSSHNLYVWTMSCFAAIGGFLFGYDGGVTSGAMLLVKEDFALNTTWQEIVVTVAIAMALVSALIGGALNNRFGRRPIILLASLSFTVGAVVCGAAKNVTMLIVGRVFVGVGIGLSSMTVPMFIAEGAPAHLRGRLVAIYSIFINSGQCVASFIDVGFSYVGTDGWRYMLAVGGLPSFVQFIGFLFLPESPRWLLSQGRELEAKRVLQRIRGHPNVGPEMKDIQASLDQEKSSAIDGEITLLRMLRTPNVRRALMVGCGIQMVQQLIGITTVMYYSASIINMSGVSDKHRAMFAAAGLATANVVFSFVGIWLVDRVGRKKLTLASLIGIGVSLGLLAVGFQLSSRHPIISTVDYPDEFGGVYILNQSQCSTYRSCELCVKNTNCGFCSTEANGLLTGSCLPAATKGPPVNRENGQHLPASSPPRNVCAGPKPGTRLPAVGGGGPTETQTAHVWTLDSNQCPNPNPYWWMTVLGLVLYSVFFAPGMGPMPWVINSEIYPLWARSTGNSLSASVNWFVNMLVSVSFLTLMETITKYGAFWLYSGYAFLGVVAVTFALPETKGVKLEDMEELFAQPWCARCCPAATSSTSSSRDTRLANKKMEEGGYSAIQRNKT